MSELEYPNISDELYTARGGEVVEHRPLFQGDVFSGLEIPGVEGEAGYAMLVQHPCSMRNGPDMKDRLQVVRAVPKEQPPPLQNWFDGNYGEMPLPDLVDDEPRSFKAEFDYIGRVESAALASRRVACLSGLGTLLLQQRRIWAETRLLAETWALEPVTAPYLAEVDLLEEWLDAATTADVEVSEATEAFETFLRAPRPPAPHLQNQLKDAERRADVTRTIRSEIGRRYR